MKITKFTILILLFAVVTCSNTVCAKENAHTSKVKRSVENNFVRLQEHKKNPDAILDLDEITDEDLAQADPNEILLIIAPYKKDEDYLTKRWAYYIEIRLFHLHKQDVKLRQRVVDGLLEAHLTKSMNPYPYNQLKGFTQKDFSKNSKNKILNGLKGKEPHRCIMLCGVANIPETLPILEKLLFDETEYQLKLAEKTSGYVPKWYYPSGWEARLARARMGIKDDINKCISLIEHDLDTKGEYNLLFNLGYIRQPESIESLKKYFLSDLMRPAENKHNGKIESYSHFLMPILYDNLSNFPVKKRRARSYTKEEIDTCKKWMSKQKKWKINR